MSPAIAQGGPQAVLYLQHLKVMLKELNKEKINKLSDAPWPLEILQAVTASSAASELLLATLKMIGPLAIHLSKEPLK